LIQIKESPGQANANYFSHQNDTKILVHGMGIADDLVENTEAYGKIDGKFATTKDVKTFLLLRSKCPTLIMSLI
jgi:hypothetical protein